MSLENTVIAVATYLVIGFMVAILSVRCELIKNRRHVAGVMLGWPLVVVLVLGGIVFCFAAIVVVTILVIPIALLNETANFLGGLCCWERYDDLLGMVWRLGGKTCEEEQA
jgi:hypothetical protein